MFYIIIIYYNYYIFLNYSSIGITKLSRVLGSKEPILEDNPWMPRALYFEQQHHRLSNHAAWGSIISQSDCVMSYFEVVLGSSSKARTSLAVFTTPHTLSSLE